jgi:GT2 family glycosyltransferase
VLRRCLESLEGEVDEVIVVDNGGGGTEVQEAQARAGVRVLSPGENLGFTGGANLGAREGSGDILVFLNPDTVVSKGAIAAFERRLTDLTIGIVSARLRLLDRPDVLNSSGTRVHVSGIGWAGGYGQPADSVSELREIAAPSGAAMAIRAETFQALGGFAEELFLYLEDLELGWRARLTGLRVVLDPEADVFHDYDYSRHGRKNYFLERNRVVFCSTAYSIRLLLLLLPVLVATELGMVGIALKEGWLRDKLRAWGWLLRHAGLVGGRRRATQHARQVRDQELAPFLTAVFEPAMLPVPALLRAANPLVAGYWSLVRRLL